MSYSQFIMAVFAIYVVYYAANILYDAFLKQSKTNTGEEEEIISIGEEEEIPHKVVDEDFETGSYEKEDEKKVHIPADTRSAFPVISVQSPVSIQCCWQS